MAASSSSDGTAEEKASQPTKDVWSMVTSAIGGLLGYDQDAKPSKKDMLVQYARTGHLAIVTKHLDAAGKITRIDVDIQDPESADEIIKRMGAPERIATETLDEAIEAMIGKGPSDSVYAANFWLWKYTLDASRVVRENGFYIYGKIPEGYGKGRDFPDAGGTFWDRNHLYWTTTSVSKED